MTELLFCTREAIDRRESRLAAERTERRHSWVVDSLGDVIYELDADGRFLSLSRNLPTSLGYRPEELIGRSYSTLFSEAEQRLARFRFNERRAGDRAVREFEVTLQGKTAEGMGHMLASVTARGLYDASRRFLGTIGLIRDVSHRRKDQAAQQAFIEQRQRAEELQTVIRQMAELSQGLEQPLSTLVHESQQLADTLRESRIVDRLQALRGHAAASAELVQRLTRLARPAGASHIINRLLDEVLQSASTAAGSSGFTSDFTSTLPDYTGNRETTARFLRQLLAYAGAYLATVGRHHLLAIKTGDSADTPTLFPVAPSIAHPSGHHRNRDGEPLRPHPAFVDRHPRCAQPVPTGWSARRNARRVRAGLGTFSHDRPSRRDPLLHPVSTGLSTRLPSSERPTRRHPWAPRRPRTWSLPLAPSAAATHGSRRRCRQRSPRIVRLGRNGHEPLCEWSRDTSEGRLPPLPSQEAVIRVTTAVATLEISGQAHTRPAAASGIQLSIQPDTQLIVQFTPNQTERQFLPRSSRPLMSDHLPSHWTSTSHRGRLPQAIGPLLSTLPSMIAVKQFAYRRPYTPAWK